MAMQHGLSRRRPNICNNVVYKLVYSTHNRPDHVAANSSHRVG